MDYHCSYTNRFLILVSMVDIGEAMTSLVSRKEPDKYTLKPSACDLPTRHLVRRRVPRPMPNLGSVPRYIRPAGVVRCRPYY
jgi:hypothetical protein